MIPTNLADAIAAAQNGSDAITQILIGDILVTELTGLRVTRRKEVNRRPVQSGFSVDIGVLDTPTEIEMDILLANPRYSAEDMITAALTGNFSGITETSDELRDALYAMMEAKEIVDIQTHDALYSSFVISQIDPYYDADENWNGFLAHVTFQSFGSQGDSSSAVDLANAKTSASKYVGGL